MIYAIFTATITRPEAVAAYRDKAGPALAKHGGKVEQATATPSALDGNPTIPDIAAVLSFPDRAAAQAWIDDPDLTDVHALRRGCGQTEILLLG